MKRFWPEFQWQLWRWTIHCSVNALPSFIIAAGYLQMWRSPPAMAAMVTAIACFIVGYAVLMTIGGPLAESGSLPARAVRLGARVRLWISGLTTVLLIPAPWMMLLYFSPDPWAGMAAIWVVNQASGAMGGSRMVLDYDSSASAEFLPVFAATVIEGLILSLLLFMIAFFALLVMQRREGRKAMA